MRISCKWEPYTKGMLLEANRLNADFKLGHFLTSNMATRWSDGIMSGLRTRVNNGTLYLEPGMFRLGGLAWIKEVTPVELPPPNRWMRLWLSRDSDMGDFSLMWLPETEQPQDSLCLCRLHFTTIGALNDSWVLSDKAQKDPAQWLRVLQVAGSPQLEFAMAASLGLKPTLLPCIQQALAPEGPMTLRLCLLNGLFPLLDYFKTSSWQEALENLACLLEPDKGENIHRIAPHELTVMY